jgi:hypothetical protein
MPVTAMRRSETSIHLSRAALDHCCAEWMGSRVTGTSESFQIFGQVDLSHFVAVSSSFSILSKNGQPPAHFLRENLDDGCRSKTPSSSLNVLLGQLTHSLESLGSLIPLLHRNEASITFQFHSAEWNPNPCAFNPSSPIRCGSCFSFRGYG